MRSWIAVMAPELLVSWRCGRCMSILSEVARHTFDIWIHCKFFLHCHNFNLDLLTSISSRTVIIWFKHKQVWRYLVESAQLCQFLCGWNKEIFSPSNAMHVSVWLDDLSGRESQLGTWLLQTGKGWTCICIYIGTCIYGICICVCMYLKSYLYFFLYLYLYQ